MTIRLTFSAIVAAACELSGTTLDAVRSGSRQPNITKARRIIAALAHKCGFSYPEIAAHIGRNKSHSTVLQAAVRADPWDVEQASIMAVTACRWQAEDRQRSQRMLREIEALPLVRRGGTPLRLTAGGAIGGRA